MRRGRSDRRGRQRLPRGGRSRRRACSRGLLVERARQAQHRPVRRRAPDRAGRDRLEPRPRPRQGADRRAVRARRERQRHHGVARALCLDRRRRRRQHRRSDGVGAGARQGGRQPQDARPGAAHLRHDVSVLDPQLPAPVLDGGRRRRSRRGRAPRGAAAALHGREPRQQARRRLLRRRAVEFGRGRSRHRLHPALRLGNPGARRREGARGAQPLGAGQSRYARAPGARPCSRRGLHRGRGQPRRGRGDARRRRTASGSRRSDPPHARRPHEGVRPTARRASIANYLLVGRNGAGRPDPAQAAWLYAQMVRWGQAPLSDEMRDAAMAVFRADLYDAALGPAPQTVAAEPPTASARSRGRPSTRATSPPTSPPGASAACRWSRSGHCASTSLLAATRKFRGAFQHCQWQDDASSTNKPRAIPQDAGVCNVGIAMLRAPTATAVSVS